MAAANSRESNNLLAMLSRAIFVSAPKLLSSCLEQSTGNGVKIFETNNFFCSSSSDDQISQKVIEKNVFVDYKKRFEKTRIPIPVRPVETKNSNHEKSETTKKISKESNLETPASSAHDEKSNSKTSIFHKFLYNNEQKQVGSDLSKSKTSAFIFLCEIERNF